MSGNGAYLREYVGIWQELGPAQTLAAVREVVKMKGERTRLGKNVGIIDEFTDTHVVLQDGRKMTYDEIATAGNTIYMTDTTLKEGEIWKASQRA